MKVGVKKNAHFVTTCFQMLGREEEDNTYEGAQGYTHMFPEVAF